MLYIVNGDKMLETIPLNEILNVSEMNDDPSSILRRSSAASTNSKPTRSESIEMSRVGRVGLKSQKSLASTEKSLTADGESKRLTGIGGRYAAIQITTSPDGFNFGKTYYLRVFLEASNQTIVSELSAAAKMAKALESKNLS